MPWWGSPDLHQAFLRYASTLTMMLDYRLWPNHPALMHLHSLLWLAAAVFAAALLYREVLGATWVAGLAALMYALDGAHAVPAAYLANRNALIACCFGFLSVLAFVRWRKRGRATTRWLSVLMLALALSAGEMGLATVAYLFSYALTVDADGYSSEAYAAPSSWRSAGGVGIDLQAWQFRFARLRLLPGPASRSAWLRPFILPASRIFDDGTVVATPCGNEHGVRAGHIGGLAY